MREHRRLGVPVRLATDVDPGDDDVHLAAGLGELDQPTQGERDPVHVLGAGVHRDQRTARHGEPLDRQPVLERVGERGVHAPALRLGEVAEPLRRVGQDGHALHALGDHGGVVGEQPDDQVRDVGARLAVDGDEPVVGVEFELHERVGRQTRRSAAVR